MTQDEICQTPLLTTANGAEAASPIALEAFCISDVASLKIRSGFVE